MRFSTRDFSVTGGEGAMNVELRRQARASAPEVDNFHVSWKSDVDPGDVSQVTNGTIGGITPTLDGGDTLDTLPPPTIDLNGAEAGTLYVFAEIAATLLVTDSYVHGFSITSIDIKADAVEPTSDGLSLWYILLATVTNGLVATPQPFRRSLEIHLTDSGNADGTAILLVAAAI